MSAIAKHNYTGRVAEELADLERELAESGVRAQLALVVSRLDLPADLALAAVYRAARRSGLSLRVMLTELTAQLDEAERPGVQ